MDEQFKELQTYIDERTRAMETRLVTELRKWAIQIEASIKKAQPDEESDYATNS